ncbi:MAG: hypothetical protein MJ082_02825 [Clostridia bacterium]|nr:hypothetical protein [Clostridia bacterium]
MKNRKKIAVGTSRRRNPAVAEIADKKRDTVARCFLVENALRTAREGRCR